MEITKSKRLEAIDHFDSLLRGETLEHTWQKFFNENPYVLTESLPLRLTSLYPHVKLESGEPDFVFCESIDQNANLGYYGVIELKKPQDRILRVYSTKQLVLSSSAYTASEQSQRYIESLTRGSIIDTRYSFAIGNTSYAFIIIGTSKDIIQKCISDASKLQFKNLLPNGFSIIPYDTLFNRFREITDKPMSVSFCSVQSLCSDFQSVPRPKQFVVCAEDDDYGNVTVCRVVAEPRWFPLRKGIYRQKYFINRKLWPIGGVLLEQFDFEVIDKISEREHAELVDGLQSKGGKLPETLSISGLYDPDGNYWPAGAQMDVIDSKGRFQEIDLPDWQFRLFQGDKLFHESGQLLFSTSVPGSGTE